MTKSSKSFYPWLVMVCCGLMAAGSIGFFTVVAGNFYYPVSVDLGVEESLFTIYMTIASLGMAVSMPLAGKFIPTMNFPVVLSVLSAAEILAVAAMSMYTEVWMWYVSGAVIGFAMGFNTTVCISTVLTNWFWKKTGFAIGMAWGIASACSAVMSPIISACIQAIGWRPSYLVLAAVSAAILLPSTLFVIRLHPKDKGMLPYGYEESAGGEDARDLEGVSFKVAVKSPAFIALVACMSLVVMTTVINQLFPTYGASVGFDPAIGGLMVSVAMMCDIAWNPIVGATCDKFGPGRAIPLWSCVTILSFVALSFSANSPILACIGSGLNDSMYAVFGAGIATLAAVCFGPREYGRIFSLVPAIGYVIGSIGAPLLTYIFEQTGSFQGVWFFCMACDVVIAVLAVVAVRLSKNLKRESGPIDAPAEA